MTTPFPGNDSHQPYRQSELLPIIVSMLPQQSDPTMFLKTFNETVRSLRDIDEDPQAKVQEARQTKAENEEKERKRLIAITLEHAKKQGVSPNEMPYLKRKSYDEVCAYIYEFWPELITCI